MKVNFEFTDTFSGEANYSWVRRGSKTWERGIPKEKTIIREAKRFASLTGVKCRKHYIGDTIVLQPHNAAVILFIMFPEEDFSYER